MQGKDLKRLELSWMGAFCITIKNHPGGDEKKHKLERNLKESSGAKSGKWVCGYLHFDVDKG